MDCSDSTLNLPIPKPLSLKRKRLFNDEYQETGRDPFCNEFGSNEICIDEENEFGMDPISKNTILNTIESFTDISRRLCLFSHRLRCTMIKQNVERDRLKKSAEDSIVDRTCRRRPVKELVKTLTEIQLYGMMSVWSDDMRFIFYSLIKGKRNIHIGDTPEPSKEALEFLEEFHKIKNLKCFNGED